MGRALPFRRVSRLLWFMALWVAGVAAVGALALVARWLLR